MPPLVYRLKNPITVLLQQADHYRLKQLCAGSVFVASGSNPDATGIIDGTCGDQPVLIFARDLEERAERIAAVTD
jgi:uncharacterized protein YciI